MMVAIARQYVADHSLKQKALLLSLILSLTSQAVSVQGWAYLQDKGGNARAVRARCVRFPRARTTFSFPLCYFLHLTTICPSLVVSPCAVAAG